MQLKKFVLKITDYIGGIFLILAGLLFIFLYISLQSKTANWFTAFSALLFFLGLGISAVILGVRRIYIAFKLADRKIKKS
jgi:hypothetical protein